MNVAIDERFIVKCIKVNKFICLGTPRDYEEYLFWNNIYKKIKHESINCFEGYSHLITAAGEGSRFKKENYRVPKILNIFYGNSLLDGAINSMKGANIYLLLVKDMEEDLRIKNAKNKKIKINIIKKTTKGQLLSLKELIKSNTISNSFFVSSADYRFKINKTLFEEFINKYHPDIVIFTTEGKYYAHAKYIITDS